MNQALDVKDPETTSEVLQKQREDLEQQFAGHNSLGRPKGEGERFDHLSAARAAKAEFGRRSQQPAEGFELTPPPDDIGVQQYIDSLSGKEKEFAQAFWDALKEKGTGGEKESGGDMWDRLGVQPNDFGLDPDDTEDLENYLVKLAPVEGSEELDFQVADDDEAELSKPDESYESDTAEKTIKYMEESIADGEGNAELVGWAPDKDRDAKAAMEYATKMLTVAGWEWNVGDCGEWMSPSDRHERNLELLTGLPNQS